MLNFNQTKELYDFLRGESGANIENLRNVDFTINGTKIWTEKSHLPKLTDEQAFLVLYVLQEAYNLIPDEIEKCSKCGELYDSSAEGTVVDDENYCGDCE